jgi:exportin-2 (importin alpha re-exporter)
MNLIVKISFDLNCHDLSPAFEENLGSIMDVFHTYLTYTNPLLETDDDDEAGPMERVKSGICELLQLFSYKYSDDFEEILPKFAEPTIALLMSLGPESKYDITISKALQFLTAIVRSPKYAANFNSEDALGQAVEKIILPNMTLRTSDEELFEDDPIEYIRRDLGGSDSETRRSAVTLFLRQLLEQFDQLVTTVVGKYIEYYLKEYSDSPAESWRSKDTGLYLYSSIAAKASTEKKGVVKTNQYLDVVNFFQSNVASDLVASFEDVHPILKVDAIKYLNTFRSQFTKAQLADAFPLVANHLSSPNYVVHTYTAVTIDRLLAMSSEGVPVFTAQDIEQYSNSILQHLFRLIEQGGTPEKIAENEFLMRCVMRILLVSQQSVAPILESVLTELLKITGEVSKNPSNPHFNHYLFECLGALIRFAQPAQYEALEGALHGPFMAIIDNDVVEFTPYVYQLLALLLENNAAAPLPARYHDIRERLLKSASWESRGNVPALVRLLRIIMARDAAFIVENNKVQAVLGIFNYLVISKLTESHSFDLLESSFAIIPMPALQQFINPIFNLLFQRLQDAKAGDVLKSRFARFFWFLAGRAQQGAGTDFLVKAIDSFGPG